MRNHGIAGRWTTPLAIAMLVATACQSQPPETSPADAAQEPAAMASADQLLLASAKVALPPLGVRPEDMPDPTSGGARILQSYCSTCHATPSPVMHSATDWPGVVRRMWLRMDHLDPQYSIPVPQLGERIALLDYLTANALRVTTASLPDAPGRELFQTTCSQCHELPDPRQHSSEDWFVVVRRMNQHMNDILGHEASATEVEQIVRYLGQASM